MKRSRSEGTTKSSAAQARKFTAEEKARLRQYSSLGLYRPTGDRATKSRLETLRKLDREYAARLASRELLPVKFEKGSKNAKALAEFARANNLKITAKALLLPSDGRAEKVVVKTNKDGKLLVKVVKKNGKAVKSVYTPLTVDWAKTSGLDGLKKIVGGIEEKLEKNQRMFIKIANRHIGRNSFSNLKQFLRYLDQYRFDGRDGRERSPDDYSSFIENVEIIVEDKNYSQADFDADRAAERLAPEMAARGLKRKKTQRDRVRMK